MKNPMPTPMQVLLITLASLFVGYVTGGGCSHLAGTWHFIAIVVGIGYAAFNLWMLVDCIRYVEDPDTRVIEALFILLAGAVCAPLYFVQRYLPRRRKIFEKSKPVA
jgi:hydrogenase/urease accessory protein HupE